MRVNRPNRALKTTIERTDHFPPDISRFVDGIEPRDPRVVLVPFGNRLPQSDYPVLEIAVRPETSPMSRIVTVPMLVLAPRQSCLLYTSDAADEEDSVDL